jgi:hypothetical protein
MRAREHIAEFSHAVNTALFRRDEQNGGLMRTIPLIVS